MIQCIADAASVGGYFSAVKVVAMLVLTVPWLLIATWVHRDARRVLASQAAWGGAVLGVGAFGLLVWLAMPVYLMGLLVYLVLAGAAAGTYVAYRNGRCDESDKILISNFFSSMFRKSSAKPVELVARVRVYDSHSKIVTPPGPDSDKSERLAYNRTQDLVFDLLQHRASEADLSPSGRQGRLRLIVDGVVAEHLPLDLSTSEIVIQYLKGVGGMDVLERRRPQQGNITVDIADKPVDIVLTTAGTTGGQRMQFRIVQEVVRTNLEELGISEDVLERLRAANSSRSGLIIVSGRGKNGVTSTLYSLLRQHDAFIRQLVTLEAKPVVDLENITQNRYMSPESLSGSLASVIRRDPDVILVDCCPDARSAELILDASENKLILLGIQARDSFVALAKWVKLCGAAEAATRDLHGILCQVLLRKLCLQCRQPYRPDPQMLVKANIARKGIDHFYRKPRRARVDEKGRPVACGTCQESGYFGRIGAFEFLELTDEIRRLVASGADIRQIKAACRKNGMLNLQEQALRKVIEGATSIKEVIRVTQDGKKR